MLSYPGCHVRAVHWLYWNSRTWSSSDVIDMLKWRHHNMSHLNAFRNFWVPFFQHKMWYLMVSKKKNPLFKWGCDRKPIPRDHHLSSLSKPLDAKQWSSVRIFLSYPHTHDRFLYSEESKQRFPGQTTLGSEWSLLWDCFVCTCF